MKKDIAMMECGTGVTGVTDVNFSITGVEKESAMLKAPSAQDQALGLILMLALLCLGIVIGRKSK